MKRHIKKLTKNNLKSIASKLKIISIPVFFWGMAILTAQFLFRIYKQVSGVADFSNLFEVAPEQAADFYALFYLFVVFTAFLTISPFLGLYTNHILCCLNKSAITKTEVKEIKKKIYYNKKEVYFIGKIFSALSGIIFLIPLFSNIKTIAIQTISSISPEVTRCLLLYFVAIFVLLWGIIRLYHKDIIKLELKIETLEKTLTE